MGLLMDAVYPILDKGLRRRGERAIAFHRTNQRVFFGHS